MDSESSLVLTGFLIGVLGEFVIFLFIWQFSKLFRNVKNVLKLQELSKKVNLQKIYESQQSPLFEKKKKENEDIEDSNYSYM